MEGSGDETDWEIQMQKYRNGQGRHKAIMRKLHCWSSQNGQGVGRNRRDEERERERDKDGGKQEKEMEMEMGRGKEGEEEEDLWTELWLFEADQTRHILLKMGRLMWRWERTGQGAVKEWLGEMRYRLLIRMID